MSESVVTVDVRGMLCAQALQVAWKAMRGISEDSVLALFCNASDVKTDLLLWAKELGHVVIDTEEGQEGIWLWVRKGQKSGSKP